jgi:hypothetical protein
MDYTLIASLAEAGFTFAPTDAGMTRSNRTGWAEYATSDFPTIKRWLDSGDSLVSVANHGHQYIFDIDDPTAAIAKGFKMEWLDGMFVVDTPSGGLHASGLHDAASTTLTSRAYLNVRAEKNNPKSKLIVELKLNHASTAAPTAERFGRLGKKDGVYQPRGPFTGTVTGINLELLAWVKANMDDRAVTSTHGTFNGLHPDFVLADFLENEGCSEYASGVVDGAFHVTVDECPHCGASAVKSTLRAQPAKFIFGDGTKPGFNCNACGVATWQDHCYEMAKCDPDYEPWEGYIYKVDDPAILAKIWGNVDELSAEPEGVVEPENAAANIYKADTTGLEWLGVTTDEDDYTYTFYAQKVSDIEMKEMEWLWPEKIPAGMVTIISGKADSGKTLCLIDWVARVTTGSAWPDGSPNTQGPKKVLMCSAEDDPARTMRPRLVAAGADIDKILIPKITVRAKGSENETTGHLNIKRDLLMIAKIIKNNPDISVLILDPITSYLGGANLNKDEEIRPLMDKLILLGQRTGLTILALVHSNKRSDVDAVEKVMGASSVAAGARAVWTIGKDADDPSLYRMGLAKGNVIKKKGGFEFQIVDAEVFINGKAKIHPRIQWGKETDVDANDMLRADRQRARGGDEDSKMNIAIAILRETVPGFAKSVFEKATCEGINERAIYRAKDKLGIQSNKTGGRAFWFFPGQKGDPMMKPTVPERVVPNDFVF